MKILVLGADSSVGSCVLSEAKQLGFECLGTSRRTAVGGGTINLDLLQPKTWEESFAWKPSVVIGCLAVSNLKECEENMQSRLVNVTAVCELLDRFGRHGARTILLSTNSVFGGDRDHCGEDEQASPRLVYSRQKAEAEHEFLAAAAQRSQPESAAVVRLTRVLTPHVAPFPLWAKDLLSGRTVEAFTDFVFSPISCRYAARGLLRVAGAAEGGIFHLSGEIDLSYFDFAELLARHVGKGCVRPTTSLVRRVDLLFRPAHSALGMTRTTRLLAIRPQAPSLVIAELADEWARAA
jgi:dTDP-4-dehydrorhamnose reductase